MFIMENAFRSLRGLSLAFLILGAFNYAHLVATSGTTVIHCSGIGRVGRDLTRRSDGDDLNWALICDAILGG